jgi:hypothetical protein
VQRIKNDFTCTVYEIHARIALEKVSRPSPSFLNPADADRLQGDLGEFNQCQGQLRELYKRGLSGHVMEFLGYRILYLLYSRNRAGESHPPALTPPTNEVLNLQSSITRWPNSPRQNEATHQSNMRSPSAMPSHKATMCNSSASSVPLLAWELTLWITSSRENACRLSSS